MDMSNVKAISTEVVVNNVRYRKGVKEIKDSNNNVLWSYKPGWTTIWEGNKTFTIYGDTPYTNEYICHGIFKNNVSNPQYRLTFSFNYNKPTNADLLYVNPNNPDFVTTTPTTSPFTITIPANDYVRLLYLGISGSNMPDASIYIDQVGDTANNGINNIWFVGGGEPGPSNYYVSITLTKIEQYIA